MKPLGIKSADYFIKDMNYENYRQHKIHWGG